MATAVHDHLQPIDPLSPHASIRQAVVADDGFPGVLPGDVALVAPLAGFNGDCLYAMAFPGEGVSLWRCQSRPVPGRGWALHLWQGDARTAVARIVTREDFAAAVLGWVAGTFRLHSRGIMAFGAVPALFHRK